MTYLNGSVLLEGFAPSSVEKESSSEGEKGEDEEDDEEDEREETEERKRRRAKTAKGMRQKTKSRSEVGLGSHRPSPCLNFPESCFIKIWLRW